jgi:hypothetical protein
MAKKRKSAGKAEEQAQRFDVWQVDCRQMAATVRTGDRSVRPWMVVVVSSTEDEEAVLAFELIEEEPDADDVHSVVKRAMLEPASGDPHRPTSVQVCQKKIATALKPILDEAGIQLEVLASLERVDEVFNELSGQIPSFEGDLPSLLDVPGVTPDVAGSFFDAAAELFEQAPWKKTGERPIRVSCSRLEGGPWYAVLMGQGGMTRGLVLYDDLDTLRSIAQGGASEQENASRTAALAVIYGGPEEMPEEDLAAATKHQWRIAGPEAYPVVYRMDPGLAVRPPEAWELELLDGCMRALPEFVRKKTRRLAPLAIAVPVPAGDLPLELAWENA